MTGICENEVNIEDQVNEDFDILKGTLELMSAAATGDLGTIEECLIPVFDNLQRRVDRIHKQYQKHYYELYPMPEKKEIESLCIPLKDIETQEEKASKELQPEA